MGLLKTLLVGAAAYGVYKFTTQKHANGKSIMDDIKEKAPQWKDKMMHLKEKAEQKFQTNEF